MKLRLLYIYNFLHYAGDTIGEVFSAVLLYSLGFSIVNILVFLGLKWGVMAFLTPLMPVVTSRIGYFKTDALSALAILSASLILTVIPAESASYTILGLLLVLYGIGGALTTPIQTTMKVLFIPEPERGRVNGRLFAIRALAVMSVSFLVGFFIEHSFVMIVAIAGTLMASLIPLGILFAGVKRPKPYSYGAAFGMMKHKTFRRYMPAFMLRSFMHVEKFLIPLYIFLLVGDLKILAIYVVLSTLLEMVAMLAFGQRYDKNRRRTLRWSALFRSLSSVFLGWRFLVERLPIFGQTFSRISGRAYDNIYQAYEQRIIKETKLEPSATSAAVETTICLAEMVVCITFAILATALSLDIFLVIFACSIIAAWLIYFKLRKI